MDCVILFYDGDCGLCNRTVQFVMKHERSSTIQFCALQSDFASDFFAQHNLGVPNLDTVCLYKKGRLLRESQAVFEVVGHLKWHCHFFRVFAVLPQFLTNKMYRFIAKRRRKSSSSCTIRYADQRHRMIG